MNKNIPHPTMHRTGFLKLEGAMCALLVCCALPLCFAQGTIRIGFEGPPLPGRPAPQPPGTYTIIPSYTESGYYFDSGIPGMSLVGPGTTSAADDGTANLYPSATLYITLLNGMPFNLISFDAAEPGSFRPAPTALHVVGYKYGGGTVTQDFLTDGICDGPGGAADFETFVLDPVFSGLSRVAIEPGHFALDNMIISVPEPSALALLPVGILVLAWSIRKRRGRGLQ